MSLNTHLLHIINNIFGIFDYECMGSPQDEVNSHKRSKAIRSIIPLY